MAPRPAQARDNASLQIAIPTPDPVVAGEVMTVQVLAVNTGSEIWQPGTYFWEAEIYDIERKFVATLESQRPAAVVSPGGVSSAELKFPVPDNYLGRRYVRVFLTRNRSRLIESRYIPFQITERPIQPILVPDYKFGGNVTVSVKKSTLKNITGTTTANVVGKMPKSSFLFNMNVLHSNKQVFDPDIILFNYYAPWGVVNLGDIAPTISQLALASKGLRGGSLEQGVQKNDRSFDWVVVFGRSEEEIVGNATTNGRFRRMLLGGKFTYTPASGRYKLFVDAVRSADDQGSLSSDPLSPQYRGPTIKPLSNVVMGAGVEYSIVEGMDLVAEYQKSDFDSDITIGTTSITDAAYRAELRYRTDSLQTQISYQTVGTDFVSLGAPNAIPDRTTVDAAVSYAPWEGVSLFLSGNQFTDNLRNNPALVTTTQRVLTGGSSLLLATKTNIGLSYSLNTALGDPANTQDNETSVIALGLSQPVGRQVYSLSVQQTAFKDKTKLSDDLDTFTVGARASLSFVRGIAMALGGTNSATKNKIDGSQRTSTSVSLSMAAPLKKDKLTSQVFVSQTQTKNDSVSSPSDTKSLSANLEFTWQARERLAVTFGGGKNKFEDSFNPATNSDDTIVQGRLSYTF